MAFSRSSTVLPVTDDITQEALRRIAENKSKAEEALREKAILEQMKKIEHDALPKCVHGVISDPVAYDEYAKKYLPHTGYVLRPQQHFVSLPVCSVCNEEAKKRAKEAADKKAAADAAIVEEQRRIAEQERLAAADERARLQKIQIAKMVEEKSIALKKNKAILNFTNLYEPVWTAETFYLRQDGIGKYVPVADSLQMLVPRYLIGQYVGSLITPTQWTTHFTDGLIPFLPACPCCAKPTRIQAAAMDRNGQPTPAEWPNYVYHIDAVYCDYSAEHYRWVASSNKHYKNGSEWDPMDPDGVKADALRRDAELAAAEKQMAELQTKIQRLKGE